MTIEINVLGSLSITSSTTNSKIIKLSKKGEFIVAYLAVENRVVERSLLAQFCWPNQATEAAMHSLRNCLLHIRKAGIKIINEGLDKCFLDTENVIVDWHKLMSVKIPPIRRELLLAAAHMYRDLFLYYFDAHWAEDELETWIRNRRDEAQRTIIDILRRLAESTNIEDAIAAGEQCMRIDPVSDKSCQGLMRAYYKAGDFMLAFRTYKTHQEAIRREFGSTVSPSAGTISLFRAIRDKTGDVDIDNRIPSQRILHQLAS